MTAVAVVSDWELVTEPGDPDRGLWRNRHGWVCRRQAAAREAVGIVWVGFRPDPSGRGDRIRPDGRPGAELVWARGWGEVWALDLETLMQRVDHFSGVFERLAEHAPHQLGNIGRAIRGEAVTQLQLGLWPAEA